MDKFDNYFKNELITFCENLIAEIESDISVEPSKYTSRLTAKWDEIILDFCEAEPNSNFSKLKLMSSKRFEELTKPIDNKLKRYH